MSNSKLQDLLKEKEARENYQFRVIGALKLRYRLTDKEKTVARESATAGHVYSYLAGALKESNSNSFKVKIRRILEDSGVIKPVSSQGLLWFKGILALEEDLEKASLMFKQHRKDVDNYRIRQREFANRRYQIPTATKTDDSPT